MIGEQMQEARTLCSPVATESCWCVLGELLSSSCQILCEYWSRSGPLTPRIGPKSFENQARWVPRASKIEKKSRFLLVRVSGARKIGRVTIFGAHLDACSTVVLVALNENACSTDAVDGHARPVGWPSPGRGCQASWAASSGKAVEGGLAS